MRNLTTTGKSVFWTMEDGTEVVCRVVTKGGGQKLVDLINLGVTDFVLDHIPSHRARYISYQNERLCRISIKAFHQLIKYLVGGVSALPNQLTKTTKKLINNDYCKPDSIQQSSDSTTTSSDISADSQQPTVWVEVDAQVDFGNAQPLFSHQSLGSSDSLEQGSCVSSIQRLDSDVQLGGDFLTKLEKFDEKLRADVERGNSFIEQGTELVSNGSGIEREVGESYVGTGQLVVRVANLRRGQVEIALEQREIACGQLEIACRQRQIRAGQAGIAGGVNQLQLGVIEFQHRVIQQYRDMQENFGLDFSKDIAEVEMSIAKIEAGYSKIALIAAGNS